MQALGGSGEAMILFIIELGTRAPPPLSRQFPERTIADRQGSGIGLVG